MDSLLLLLAVILVPAAGAAIVRRASRPRFLAALFAAGTAALALAAAIFAQTAQYIRFDGSAWIALDQLTAIPSVLFTMLTLAVIVAAPKSAFNQDGYSSILVLLSSTMLCYSAASPLAFFLGWSLSTLPFLIGPWKMQRSLPSLALGGSILLLGAGLGLNEAVPSAEYAIFALITLAALLRKGVFPFHTWVISAFSEGPLLPIGLLVNAHFGALLFARVAIPSFPELSQVALPLVGDLALVSAIYAAFVGLGEDNGRRLLAFTMLSQASFILSGLESRTIEGITGALTHWLVVAIAMTGLLLVYCALEARGVLAAEARYLGLAVRGPRLAVFFAICGLALVGLPGTLGYVAEDLLFHGALETNSFLGVALPLATALNGVNIFRLFSHIFMGRRPGSVPVFPDALPRERTVLAGFVLLLVLAGFFPGHVLPWRTEAANSLTGLLSSETDRH